MERRRARLHKLEVVYRRRAPRPRSLPDWDPTALTQEEMLELDDLLREPERYQRRTGTTDNAECYTATLSETQLERLETLMTRIAR